MNGTPDNATNGGSVAPPSVPAPDQGIDRAQYEAELARVRGERDQIIQAVNQLKPLEDDITWMLADPENVKFVRESRQAYENARKTRNQVPDELKPLAEKVDRLNSFVDNFEASQRQAQEEPRRRWIAEGKAFAEDLIRKHPNELGRQADPNMGWAGALESLCASRGLSWEEGWKILAPSFVRESSGPPPTSLRADAGFAGLPPPSRQPSAPSPDGKPKTLGQHVIERMHSMS